MLGLKGMGQCYRVIVMIWGWKTKAKPSLANIQRKHETLQCDSRLTILIIDVFVSEMRAVAQDSTRMPGFRPSCAKRPLEGSQPLVGTIFGRNVKRKGNGT
jgi:hypothetical protein